MAKRLVGFKEIAAFVSRISGRPYAERTMRAYAARPAPENPLPCVRLGGAMLADPTRLRRWLAAEIERCQRKPERAAPRHLRPIAASR